MNFGVVIVTYNRIELLKECIQNVKNQIEKYDYIIIVNNNSSDGTREYLDTVDEIITINLNENTGGAGGFRTGVKKAMSLGCDWVTLIDDDAMLQCDFLMKTKSWLSGHKPVLATCGKVVTDNIISLPFARRIWRDNTSGKVYRYPVSKVEYDSEYFFCDEVTFCGLTVNSSIVKKIGYPNLKYFTQYDDTEYSAKIRKHTQIALITDAAINHKLAIRTSTGGNLWREYYSIRNEIYMVKKNYGIRAAYFTTQYYMDEYYSYIRKIQSTEMRKRIIRKSCVDAWLGIMGKRTWAHKL